MQPKSTTDQARVAVLIEPEMPIFSVQLAMQPPKVKPILEGWGIAADELSAAELADANLFNAKRYTVLVLPSGNSFPLPAYENMRQFHKDGGCLIVNGIAFCHPIELRDGHWHDQGHIEYLHHDERGIGTGNFRNPPATLKPLQKLSEADPLDLPEDILPRTDEHLQWLNPDSFPKEDEVLSIVDTRTSDGGFEPTVAIIKHHCLQFDGAMTMWLGQYASSLEQVDQYYLTQVLVRGAGYFLNAKGKMSDSAYRQLKRKLDAVEKPPALARNIEPVTTPRPWGDTFLPKSNPPAETLLVVDMTKLSNTERIAMGCLQGLTSRDVPALWLNFGESDQFWLDWHKQKGYIRDYQIVGDYREIFERFKDDYRGGIVYDPNLYCGELLACNVAACEDLIIVTPKLAEELNIPIRIDLRGRFETYAEGMRWVWQQYKDRLNHHLCDIIFPRWLSSTAFAYDIQHRGIVFWISGPVDSAKPGADPVAETTIMAEIFSEMPPNIAMLGFTSGGEGNGLGEVGGTRFAGAYGKNLIPTDSLSNTCVTSGIQMDALIQKKPPAAPALEDDKVYIALTYSDGDNQNVWRVFFKRFLDDPLYGDFPVSFGMGPTIIDLQPAVAQWYYENADAMTEYICDVSGIGYMRPDSYGVRFRDKKEVFDGFLDWTGNYMRKMDMETVRTVSGGDEYLKRYIEKLGFMHSVFADMGHPSGAKDYHEHTYSLEEMPVFRSICGWGGGQKGYLAEVQGRIGDVRPAFVNVMVHAWTFGNMADLKKYFVDELDSDYVIVTPAQLAQLFEQAKKKKSDK